MPKASANGQELYEHYSKELRRCVDRIYADGSDADLADRFRANVSRFAAYKADYVQTTVQNILNDTSIPLKQREEMAEAAVAGFNRYSQAERNTALARCRTAKQWKEFNDPQRLRLFPNLRWIGTRSANPRQTHKLFEDKVWAKDDDFWNKNMPGQEWNCKCDLEETDDPVTDNREVEAKTKDAKVPLGLEGNPARTGEIFTDRAGYVSKGDKQKVEQFWKPIDEGFKTYCQYRDDANYENVKMNWNNGGMMATHRKHCMHDKPDERRYFGKTNGELEQACQEEFFKKGDHVLLLADNEVGQDKKTLPALDLNVNGKFLDIRSITENNENTIKNGLWAKERQIRRVYKKTGVEADTVCLFFYNETMYSEQKVKEGIRDFIKCQTNIRIKHVVCVVRNQGIVEEYDIK